MCAVALLLAHLDADQCQQMQSSPVAALHNPLIQTQRSTRHPVYSVTPLKAFMLLLLAVNPAVTFNPSGLRCPLSADSTAAPALQCCNKQLTASRIPLCCESDGARGPDIGCDDSSYMEPLLETLTPTRTSGSPIEPRTVYFVSTPIGNLEDITLRAMRTLREVDVIAAEDTRVTGMLLKHLGIERKGQLVSHHDHNLHSSVPKLVELLEGGASVALVSDAGTPGISDPGLALAAECVKRDIPIAPVPGPCAAIAALSVAGVAATEFLFMGFLPRTGKLRRLKVAEAAQEPRAVVLYEAPHRMIDTLDDLSAAGASQRGVLCARELTKMHEELHRGTVASATSWWASVVARDGKVRGEFVIVIAPLDQAALDERHEKAEMQAEAAAAEEVRAQLAAGVSVSRAAKEVAAKYGLKKSKVYAEALRQNQADD